MECEKHVDILTILKNMSACSFFSLRPKISLGAECHREDPAGLSVKATGNDIVSDEGNIESRGPGGMQLLLLCFQITSRGPARTTRWLLKMK